eukprot:Pgem_evm1s8407
MFLNIRSRETISTSLRETVSIGDFVMYFKSCKAKADPLRSAFFTTWMACSASLNNLIYSLTQ